MNENYKVNPETVRQLELTITSLTNGALVVLQEATVATSADELAECLRVAKLNLLMHVRHLTDLAKTVR